MFVLWSFSSLSHILIRSMANAITISRMFVLWSFSSLSHILIRPMGKFPTNYYLFFKLLQSVHVLELNLGLVSLRLSHRMILKICNRCHLGHEVIYACEHTEKKEMCVECYSTFTGSLIAIFLKGSIMME
jgi:hypothetical protein